MTFNRLDRLISDISSASRLDAELSREEMEKIDLKSMLYRLRDAYKKPLDRADDSKEDNNTDHDKIRVIVAENLECFVIGSEDRLAQVFGNLISNALSFLPAEGVVEISITRDGEEIITNVEDNGPGIPENKLNSIFERFYTERPDHEDYGAHSGLGLSISKQIIDAHEGVLYAENKEGASGARFVVKLKAA